MKKIKKSDDPVALRDEKRHKFRNIWVNGHTGNVRPTGWMCAKCGLTIMFGDKKEGPSILFGGGKCLLASGYEDRKNWGGFTLFLVAIIGIFVLTGFAIWSIT